MQTNRFSARTFHGRGRGAQNRQGRGFGSRYRPASRSGGFRGARKGGRNFGQYIDPKKFINRAVITEEIENFIPEHSFSDFIIRDELKNAVLKRGYKEPTPIQDRAIPHILKNVDILGIANTGTGKTAAFLVPLINKVLNDRKEQVLIVTPTRELALQIENELKALVFGMGIFSVSCVGGAPIYPQLRALKHKNNFVVGTPGRLKDLIDRKSIILSSWKTIVLDEADRMLDMGFVEDMKFIINGMPKDRHTLLFSATVSKEIEKMINDYLKNPVKISVKTGDTAKNVDQDIVKIVRGSSKIDTLHTLLNGKDFVKVLVFGRTKHGVESISQTLLEKGIKAESIHGNKSHSQRQKALKSFKDGHVQALVATDVAARGLDIADVSHVINFDIPATYDDYVHRIGRTGRGNKKGKALTFIE